MSWWRRDRKRCRYSDCVEQHPVASDEEQVTCATCREWLGLPPLEPKARHGTA